MHKILLAILLLLPLTVWAGELTQEVEPKTPLTKRVMLVMDCSGSMVTSDNVVAKALGQLSVMFNQPVDDMEIAVVCFNDSVSRWEGVPEEGLAKGWARLPSATAAETAFNFVEEHYEAHSATYFAPALAAAITEPVKDLTIILITDGRNTGESEATISIKVKEAQAARAKDGLPAVPIWAIDADSESNEWLKELVAAYGGGYWTCE